MNRRNFLSLISAGVAGIALEQAIPLGRVWSFPKEIVIPEFFAGFDPDSGEDRVAYIRRALSFGDPYTYAAIRAAGWKFPRIVSVETITGKYSLPKFTAAFPPDSSHTPS